MSGTLYIVATPIGNLEDITMRAVRILSEVDLIIAEDTRHTLKLLNHLKIKKPMISYYKQNEIERSKSLIDRLKSGENIALVSDAGTPRDIRPGRNNYKKCFKRKYICNSNSRSRGICKCISCFWSGYEGIYFSRIFAS